MEDHSRTLQPGQTIQIHAHGDFVFLKETATAVRVLINEKPVVMDTGDSIHPDEPFEKLEIENLDTLQSVAFTVVIGRGNFRRNFISGTVTTTPGIYTKNSGIVGDSRYQLPLKVRPKQGTDINTDAFAIFREVEPATQFTAGSSLSDWQQQVPGWNWASKIVPKLLNASCNYAKSSLVHMAVLAMKSGANKHWALSYNPETGTVYDRGQLDDLGEPQCYARGEFYEYMGDSHSSSKGVWRRPIGETGAASWDRIYSSKRVYDFEILSSGRLVLGCGSDGYALIESSGDIVKTSGTDAQQVAIVGDEIHVFAGGSNKVKRYDHDLNYIGQLYEPGNLSVVCGWKYWLLVQNSNLTPTALNLRDPFSVYVPLAGDALEVGCGDGAGLLKRVDDYGAVRSSAAVTLEGQAGPTPLAKGEIIRLALSWFYETDIADGYLDYVHAVEIISSGGADGVKQKRTYLETNGETFAYAGVDDDFEVVMPAKVTITLDHRFSPAGAA